MVALASLTDPAKLATLTSERAANPRLLKCVYWLADARARGLDPAKVISDAQTTTGDTPAHAALVRDALLRNLKIADGLGLLTADNLALLRRGRSPTVTRGPYADEPAEVDHILPLSVAPEVGNEIANLELMPRTINRRKGAKIGPRQLAIAKELAALGLLAPETLRRLQ